MEPFTVRGLSSVLEQVLPEPHAGLMAGLLFGTKATLPREFYNALVTTGTLHIIALSGMNISIMQQLIAFTLLPVVGKRMAAAVTIGIIVWFVWFVGGAPSIVRAAIMGSISMVSVISGRHYWGILSWGIAAGSMLLVKPSWALDISFQLSALASLGLMLFGGTVSQRPSYRNVSGTDAVSGTYLVRYGVTQAMCWMENEVRTGIRLTLAAQVFTVPLIFFAFRRVSLIAPVVNVAIGWVIVPLTVLGWMTVLAGWLVLYAGQIIAWVDWILLEYLVRTVYFFSLVPGAGIAL